jgi:hypothetical protein
MRVVDRRPIPLVSGFARRLTRWMRISHAQRWLARAIGFPRFLADDFGCGSVRALAATLMRRVARRMLRTAPRGGHPLP